MSKETIRGRGMRVQSGLSIPGSSQPDREQFPGYGGLPEEPPREPIFTPTSTDPFIEFDRVVSEGYEQAMNEWLDYYNFYEAVEKAFED